MAALLNERQNTRLLRATGDARWTTASVSFYCQFSICLSSFLKILLSKEFFLHPHRHCLNKDISPGAQRCNRFRWGAQIWGMACRKTQLHPAHRAQVLPRTNNTLPHWPEKQRCVLPCETLLLRRSNYFPINGKCRRRIMVICRNAKYFSLQHFDYRAQEKPSMCFHSSANPTNLRVASIAF